MMKIAILTLSYPYPPGEQFFAEELRAWANTPGVQVTVLPLRSDGVSRTVPDRVEVDLALAERPSLMRRVRFLLQACVAPITWTEVAGLLQRRQATVFRVAKAFHAGMHALLLADALRRRIGQKGRFDLVYSYWNDAQAFAAVLLKREGKIGMLATRVHGFDLYEEQRRGHYLPFKSQIAGDFDLWIPISQGGASRLVRRFGVPPARVQVGRLGVQMPGRLTSASPIGCLNVLSVSWCIPIKRVDRIIDALRLLAERRPGLRIRWMHVGAGELLQELQQRAREQLDACGVQWQFAGEMSNEAVHQLLATGPHDVFINASEQEGVPVSIMEALACGIPVVAPDVGAVSEIVSTECGMLLGEHIQPSDIADALQALYPRVKDAPLRLAARHQVEAHYDARRNYPELITRLVQMADSAASRIGTQESGQISAPVDAAGVQGVRT